MKEELKTKLITTAERKANCDEKDFCVYDYCDGNVDDAYYMGCEDADIFFAREILDSFGIKYKIKC